MTLNEAMSYADRDEFTPEFQLGDFVNDPDMYPEIDFSGDEFDLSGIAELSEN